MGWWDSACASHPPPSPLSGHGDRQDRMLPSLITIPSTELPPSLSLFLSPFLQGELTHSRSFIQLRLATLKKELREKLSFHNWMQ